MIYFRSSLLSNFVGMLMLENLTEVFPAFPEAEIEEFRVSFRFWSSVSKTLN